LNQFIKKGLLVYAVKIYLIKKDLKEVISHARVTEKFLLAKTQKEGIRKNEFEHEYEHEYHLKKMITKEEYKQSNK